MRIFKLHRGADESGVSGTGTVLEGVVFQDGTTVIRWCVKGKPNSTAIYASFEEFHSIHIGSHPTNESTIIWDDEDSWSAKIVSIQNGFVFCYNDEFGQVFAITESDSRLDDPSWIEADVAQRLCYQVLEYFGLTGNKHNKYRIDVNIDQLKE